MWHYAIENETKLMRRSDFAIGSPFTTTITTIITTTNNNCYYYYYHYYYYYYWCVGVTSRLDSPFSHPRSGGGEQFEKGRQQQARLGTFASQDLYFSADYFGSFAENCGDVWRLLFSHVE